MRPTASGPNSATIAITNAEKTGNGTTRRSTSRFRALPDARERPGELAVGRRVPVRRPRVRTADDEHELPVQTHEYFADRDPLTRAVMDRMLAGVSTRKFEQVGECVGNRT